MNPPNKPGIYERLPHPAERDRWYAVELDWENRQPPKAYEARVTAPASPDADDWSNIMGMLETWVDEHREELTGLGVVVRIEGADGEATTIRP